MKVFILASLLFSTSVFASEPQKGSHQIVCFDEVSAKKISIKIDGVFPDKYEKIATIYISNNIETPPYQVVTSKITNAQVEVLNLDLAGTGDQFITELQLNLGRSGKVLIKSDSAYGDSLVNSSMREFFYSSATMKCSYNFTLGPKPFSGGN